jgi:hypothetical protein
MHSFGVSKELNEKCHDLKKRLTNQQFGAIHDLNKSNFKDEKGLNSFNPPLRFLK